MQLHADQPIQYRPSHLHTSKTFLFPTVELFQLARNTDIKKKNRQTSSVYDCAVGDVEYVAAILVLS